jgi:diguanylate cyclase (GGDEF)-like protein
MNNPLEELRKIFKNQNKISKKNLFSVFDAAGIPKEPCWRGIYRLIFDTGVSLNFNAGENTDKLDFEPVLEKALLYVRAGIFTEKALLSLIQDYTAVYFSVCDNQLTEVLNELNFLTSEFKSISSAGHEKVSELESETVNVINSDLSIDEKTKLIKSRFKETLTQFKEDLKTVDKISQMDHLTGLYNRRFFDEQLQTEISEALKEKTWLSLLMIDIDNFKLFNDTYGHQIGDEALKAVASQMQDHCNAKSSRTGIAFYPTRYGGEEFSILLPTIDQKQALKFAEQLCKRIDTYSFIVRDKDGQIKHKDLKLTVSIGTAGLNHSQELSKSQKLIVEEADKAMYEAKRCGKNRAKAFAK